MNSAMDEAIEIGDTASRRIGRSNGALRRLLLLGLPLLAAAIAGYLYLQGGRYITVDNAYIRAEKLNLAPEVAGIVSAVLVRDNETVRAGQVLFRLDPEPYRIVLTGAEAQLDAVRNEIATTRAQYRQALAEIKQAEADLAYMEREFNRQRDLAERRVATQQKFEDAQRNLDVARQRILVLRQQAQAVLASLGGNPDRPTDEHPRVRQAMAQVAKAERDLRQTTVTAPTAGTLANLDAVRTGRYLDIGQPALSIVATAGAWLEANPKETDLGTIKPGDAVTVEVDAYPGRVWRGVVESLSPASGAEFALLPPQNASGNWVKVVQRVPVRIRLQPEPGAPELRAGMSATASIDSGRQRSLSDVLRSLKQWAGL
jgi:membrane fusion protein (multidrug efflux system)